MQIIVHKERYFFFMKNFVSMEKKFQKKRSYNQQANVQYRRFLSAFFLSSPQAALSALSAARSDPWVTMRERGPRSIVLFSLSLRTHIYITIWEKKSRKNLKKKKDDINPSFTTSFNRELWLGKGESDVAAAISRSSLLLLLLAADHRVVIPRSLLKVCLEFFDQVLPGSRHLASQLLLFLVVGPRRRLLRPPVLYCLQKRLSGPWIYVKRRSLIWFQVVKDTPPITYYWTVPLILDHSNLDGKSTSSKTADTKVSGF